MAEFPFFFNRGTVRLFAVWHRPDANAAGMPFVFCHPMAEEKLWSHRVFVTFARALAERGHPVLRVDCSGNGDSDLGFAESSLETAVADIDAALDLAKQEFGATVVGLLGLRLGASLAFRVAARRRDIGTLVLWAPILDGHRYLQDMLRINLTTQMAVYGHVREDREALGRILSGGGTVNVDGYEISGEMASQLAALLLTKEPAAQVPRCLLTQIERAPHAKPSAEMEGLARYLPGASLQVVQEEPFWKEILRFYESAPNLFVDTLRWLGHTR